mmetsp:Transcript_26631/g.71485  ORF Transcript_26631/g.71485 Transcript_26631/m.71485 type:complete len:203 (-) Transcript_26631:2573-3181(-)
MLLELLPAASIFPSGEYLTQLICSWQSRRNAASSNVVDAYTRRDPSSKPTASAFTVLGPQVTHVPTPGIDTALTARLRSALHTSSFLSPSPPNVTYTSPIAAWAHTALTEPVWHLSTSLKTRPSLSDGVVLRIWPLTVPRKIWSDCSWLPITAICRTPYRGWVVIRFLARRDGAPATALTDFADSRPPPPPPREAPRDWLGR